MQFSLRRLLLAVFVFAGTLGLFMLYAKRLGLFCSDSDPTWWWVAVTATASAASGTLLVGRRRDIGRIVNASVWAIVGFFTAAMLSDSQWFAYAIFYLFGGRIGHSLAYPIVGMLSGWFIGCVCFRWLHPLPPPPCR